MKVITRAQYTGRCATCQEPIEVGDQILWDNVTGELRCTRCAFPPHDELPAA